MIPVLLTILKILGYIVLAILGLALLLVLIVLFVPIRYRFRGEKYEAVDALFKASYLLHLIRARATYDGQKVLVKVKVLFFTVYRFEKILSEKEKTNIDEPDISFATEEIDVDEFVELLREEKEKEKNNKSEKIDNPEIKKEEDSKNSKKNLEQDDKDSIKSGDESSDKKINEKSRKKKADKKKADKKKADKSDSKESAFKKYLAKAKRFYTFLQRDENEAILSFIFKKVYKILRSILPKKLNGDLVFGLKEPDTTGYAVGFFSLLYPFIGNNLSLTPDFTRDIIKGRLKFRGRILVVEILYYAIGTIADKRVRRLIAELKAD